MQNKERALADTKASRDKISEELENAKKAIRDQESKYKTAFTASEQGKKELEEEIKTCRKTYRKFKDAEKENSGLTERVKRYEADLRTLTSELEDKNLESEESATKLQKVGEELSRLQFSEQRYAKEANDSRQNLEQLTKSLEEKETEVKTSLEKLRLASKDIQKQHETIQKLSKKIDALGGALTDSHQKTDRQEAALNKALAESEQAHNEKAEQNGTIRQQLLTIEELRMALTGSHQKNEKREADLRKALSRLRQMDKDKAEQEDTLRQRSAKIKYLRGALKTWRETNDEQEVELRSAADNLQQTDAKITGLSTDLDKSRQEVDRVNESLERSKDRILVLVAMYSRSQRIINDIKQRFARLLNHLNTANGVLDVLQRGLTSRELAILALMEGMTSVRTRLERELETQATKLQAVEERYRKAEEDRKAALCDLRSHEKELQRCRLDKSVLFEIVTAATENKRMCSCLLEDIRPATIWMCRIRMRETPQSAFIVIPDDEDMYLIHGALGQTACCDVGNQVWLNVSNPDGTRMVLRVLDFPILNFSWLEKTLGWVYVEGDLERWRPTVEELLTVSHDQDNIANSEDNMAEVDELESWQGLSPQVLQAPSGGAVTCERVDGSDV